MPGSRPGLMARGMELLFSVRVAYDPSLALELIKYQSIICSLFALVDTLSALGYSDTTQLRDPSLRWDTLKDDIFVFQTCNLSQKQPFRKNIFNRLGPQPDQRLGLQPDQRGDHETSTPSGVEICQTFNYAKCTLWASCRYAHICSVKGCGGAHPAKGCTFKQPS